jgi:hypothetical protein
MPGILDTSGAPNCTNKQAPSARRWSVDAVVMAGFRTKADRGSNEMRLDLGQRVSAKQLDGCGQRFTLQARYVRRIDAERSAAKKARCDSIQ